MKIILHIFPNMFEKNKEKKRKKNVYVFFILLRYLFYIKKIDFFFYIEMLFQICTFNFTSRNKIIFLHLSKILIV